MKPAIKTLSALLFMIITTSAMTAQDTAADYKQAETFLRPNVEKRIYRTQVIPHWINDTPRFWYKVNTRQGKQFILVDTRKKQRKQAFDHEKLAKALSTLLGKTFQGDKLPFDSITFTGKGQNITFTVDKKTIAYSPKTGTCKGVEQTQKDAFVSTSPDGKWEALVTDYNLYIRSTVTNEKIQLTRDGSRMRPYGLDWDWYAMENESLPDKKEKTIHPYCMVARFHQIGDPAAGLPHVQKTVPVSSVTQRRLSRPGMVLFSPAAR